MHLKLLELLRALPENELNQLDRFVFSPFFNENERLCTLYSYLRQFAPAFDDLALTDEAAFQHALPDRAFESALFNKINSQLFKLVEHFIAHRQLEMNAFAKDKFLLDFYNQTSLSKHFHSTLNRLEKEQEQALHKNLDFYQRQLQLETRRAELMSKNDPRTGDINLQALNGSLDTYFLLAKLMFLNSMLTRQRIVKVEYDLTWMPEVLEYLERSKSAETPAIQLYREVLLLQLHPGERAHYMRLKELLQQHANQFSKEELRDFYIYLENSVKHLFPIEDYFQELFDLYKTQLDAGILYKNGALPHTIFKNVVNAALALRAYDWAEQFIESNQNAIVPEAYRADAYFQNLAALHFAKADYAQAQTLLLQSNPVDIYYKLSQKTLLAQIYYEMRELEALENFLNTFTKFIFDQQSKIAAEKVASYRQFINFFKKLLRILTATPESIEAFEQGAKLSQQAVLQSLRKLQRQIEKAPMFYSKKWLLEMVTRRLGDKGRM